MNIHFCFLFSEIGKISKNNQERKMEFAPDGVDFYSFKIIGCLPIPRERRRSNLSTFFFCPFLNEYF